MRHLPFKQQQVLKAWLLLSPMLIVLAWVAAWPQYKSTYFSFTNVSLNDLTSFEFVAFQNYLDYFDGEWYGVLADPLWWHAVYNTFYFSVISVSLETIFGLLIALIIHSNFKGRGIMRAVILIPWAIPTIVSAKMWGWMLNDQFGIINDLLMRLSVISDPIAWTSQTNTAMATIIAVDVWKTTPFMALLILAGLQTLPKDCYLVAKVDGIHPVKVFFKVTLPLLKNTILVAVIFRMLDALRIFDLIYVLTPNNEATISMSVYVRQYLFDFDRFAYGSASSTLLFLIISMLTITFVKVGKLKLS